MWRAPPIMADSLDRSTGRVVSTMVGVAYVAAEASSLTELWRAFTTIFVPPSWCCASPSSPLR